ncbi:MAG: SIS domain-containing protein [Desulfobacterales bacterium]|nr:SIS domain-containing protein [Desulfobacterales bacterium]
MPKDKLQELKEEFSLIGNNIRDFLINTENIDKIAKKIFNSKHLILLGRGANAAVAEEGALKIKETSYIDANGYPSGEFLHGYIAALDEHMPVISIIIDDKDNSFIYNLAKQNTKDIKTKRNPHLIIIKSHSDKEIEKEPLFKDADFIDIPEANIPISCLYAVISLQILALRIAENLGRDVNNPRSLTKAITSE